MNPQLQEALDALEKADAAGNVEDAKEIADYIRQLQAQEEESSSGDMIYPAAGAAIGSTFGAVAGPAVGSAVDTAATKVAEKVAGPKGTPRGDKVAKWLATQTTGPNVGGATFEEAYKKSEIARGKPVQSRGSQIPIRKGFLGIENQPAEPSLPQKTAANIISSERLGKPSVARRIGGMGVMGAEAGKTISDIEKGDTGEAILSGIGTIGGALSQSRIKPLRAIGTGLSLLVPTVQGGKEVKDIFYPSKEEEEKKAAGGLVHLAEGGKLGKGLEVIKKSTQPLWEKYGYDPLKMRSEYPEVLPPVLKMDKKKGTEYLSKQLSPEALAVQKARQEAQKQVDAGNYTPFYDLLKRSYVDPANYPLPQRTIDLTLPKKAETLAAHTAKANDPAAIARLNAAYDAAKDSPNAHLFYGMKQLQNDYIKELGPEKGIAAFKSGFADPMAATTGGQTPNANLMMTALHNFYAGKGQPIPSKGYELPYPIGGDKLQSNINQSQKLFETGMIDPVLNPKRYNFSSNFLGHSDRPTIDDQMMRLFDPKGKGAPDYFGINEKVVNDLAAQRQVLPVNFQEVAWAGGKEYGGKPMMQEINEMIARTSMITGEKPEEVVKRFIHKKGPMFGVAGVGAGTSLEDMEGQASGGLVGYKEGGSTTPAWQRSEGKSPSGGLNALGRASYKRETGGELKAPQPEGGSRKKSFCARMGGMKKKLTSSKTANDPDSRINKALRKWKC
jgi:hypothetical protein